jgi:hypothetical protein
LFRADYLAENLSGCFSRNGLSDSNDRSIRDETERDPIPHGDMPTELNATALSFIQVCFVKKLWMLICSPLQTLPETNELAVKHTGSCALLDNNKRE